MVHMGNEHLGVDLDLRPLPLEEMVVMGERVNKGLLVKEVRTVELAEKQRVLP